MHSIGKLAPGTADYYFGLALGEYGQDGREAQRRSLRKGAKRLSLEGGVS